MSNKKIAILVSVFIVGFMLIVGLIGIGAHIPILKNVLVFIFAILLVLFVVGFFVIAGRKR